MDGWIDRYIHTYIHTCVCVCVSVCLSARNINLDIHHNHLRYVGSTSRKKEKGITNSYRLLIVSQMFSPGAV